VVDFVCLERQLVVELDGGQHNDPEKQASDQDRQGWLEENGYQVLRFWNNDVIGNMEGVLEKVREAL
jgi:very-short-patch-repair endonuclease